MRFDWICDRYAYGWGEDLSWDHRGMARIKAYEIGNRPLLLLAILLIVIGVQLLMMGFLGEMIMRIYYELCDKPVYHIRQILD